MPRLGGGGGGQAKSGNARIFTAFVAATPPLVIKVREVMIIKEVKVVMAYEVSPVVMILIYFALMKHLFAKDINIERNELDILNYWLCSSTYHQISFS